MTHDPHCTVIEAHDEEDCTTDTLRRAPYAVLVRSDGSYATWDREPSLTELNDELGYFESCPASLVRFPGMVLLWSETPADAQINGMAVNLCGVEARGPILVGGPADGEGDMLALPPAYGHYIVAMSELNAYVKGLDTDG